MAKNYGYFDNERREYVITDPRTPVKWINYIGTLGFGGYVDHTGGAALCKGDPALNRITWYEPQRPVSDFQATTLYLRLDEGGHYRIFSPFYAPPSTRTTAVRATSGWATAGSSPNSTAFAPRPRSSCRRTGAKSCGTSL